MQAESSLSAWHKWHTLAQSIKTGIIISSLGVALIAAAPPWAIRALWIESQPRLLHFWHNWHILAQPIPARELTIPGGKRRSRQQSADRITSEGLIPGFTQLSDTHQNVHAAASSTKDDIPFDKKVKSSSTTRPSGRKLAGLQPSVF